MLCQIEGLNKFLKIYILDVENLLKILIRYYKLKYDCQRSFKNS